MCVCRIRFTVVSEPPEEEEDRECEDVGVAFLRIPDILEQQQDLTETSLNSGDTHTYTNRWTVCCHLLSVSCSSGRDGQQ